MNISKIIRKYKIGEQPKDFVYWQARSYQERITALEEIRKEYNTWRYDAQQRFQRVYRIVKRS